MALQPALDWPIQRIESHLCRTRPPRSSLLYNNQDNFGLLRHRIICQSREASRLNRAANFLTGLPFSGTDNCLSCRYPHLALRKADFSRIASPVDDCDFAGPGSTTIPPAASIGSGGLADSDICSTMAPSGSFVQAVLLWAPVRQEPPACISEIRVF